MSLGFDIDATTAWVMRHPRFVRMFYDSAIRQTTIVIRVGDADVTVVGMPKIAWFKAQQALNAPPPPEPPREHPVLRLIRGTRKMTDW